MARCRRFTGSVASLICLVLASLAQAAEDSDSSGEYRGSSLRLGMFFINNIDTELLVQPERIPLAARVRLEADLGLEDTIWVPRFSYDHRFSKRHGLGAGWYAMSLDGAKSLERTVEIGDTEFDVGARLTSKFETDIYRLTYNYIFHDDEKITLSVSPGVHYSNTEITLSAEASVSSLEVSVSERVDGEVFLPMVGGRMAFRFLKRWTLLFGSDWFLIEYDDNVGSLVDTYVYFERRMSDRFSLGVGLERFVFDVEYEDDGLFWDLEHVYTGAVFFGTLHFGGRGRQTRNQPVQTSARRSRH